jgi:hypothetical protein
MEIKIQLIFGLLKGEHERTVNALERSSALERIVGNIHGLLM